MSLEDRTTPARLRAVLREARDRGRDAFLAEHGYGPARNYFVVAKGMRGEYDSKAIFGVACGMTHDQFSGGEKTVVPALERQGFQVIDARTHWYEDELVLILHWYLRYQPRGLGPRDLEVQASSKTLQDLARANDRVGTARHRSPTHVVEQLSRFADLESSNLATTAPSSPYAELWARYATDEDQRHRRVQEILTSLEATKRTASPRRKAEAATASSADEGRPRFLYGPQPKPRFRAQELEEPYQGPRQSPRHRQGKSIPHDPDKQLAGDRAHEHVRDLLATHLVDHGFIVCVGSNAATANRVDYDLGACRDDLRLIIESKSLPKAVGAQTDRLRRGLGQVLWYRRRFEVLCGERRIAVLLVERAPGAHQEWFDVCRAAGVVLTWPDQFVSLIEHCENRGGTR